MPQQISAMNKKEYFSKVVYINYQFKQYFSTFLSYCGIEYMLKLNLLFFLKEVNIIFFNLREKRINECFNKFKSTTYDFQKQSHWDNVTLKKYIGTNFQSFIFELLFLPFSFQERWQHKTNGNSNKKTPKCVTIEMKYLRANTSRAGRREEMKNCKHNLPLVCLKTNL